MKNRNMQLVVLAAVVLFIVVGGVQLSSTAARNNLQLAREKMLCKNLTNNPTSTGWHMVIFLDINSCLSCTEEMDAWRKLERFLTTSGGSFSLYTTADDLADVAAAMQLEQLQAPVAVISDESVEALALKDQGTPLKILMDNECRIVKIAGRMGNLRKSACFFQEVNQLIGR